ncbi:hypothetical protein F66182_11632 [Fusarium sp. NRRL 66182]|nr:hypothetical protein F66182_11632 [Fusarium sp. NRRL 66182]
MDTATALGTEASQIQYVFRGSDLTAVTNAYMVGIKDVFTFGPAGAVAAVLLALVIPLKQLPDYEIKKAEETIGVRRVGRREKCGQDSLWDFITSLNL